MGVLIRGRIFEIFIYSRRIKFVHVEQGAVRHSKGNVLQDNQLVFILGDLAQVGNLKRCRHSAFGNVVQVCLREAVDAVHSGFCFNSSRHTHKVYFNPCSGQELILCGTCELYAQGVAGIVLEPHLGIPGRVGYRCTLHGCGNAVLSHILGTVIANDTSFHIYILFDGAAEAKHFAEILAGRFRESLRAAELGYYETALQVFAAFTGH